MTENTVHPEQAPPTRVVDQSSGEYVDAPYIRRRLDHLPGPLRIGRDQPKIVVPFHPFVPLEHQYSAPNHGSRICLMSFAKFVCHRPHPHDPSLTIQGVKIYRVAHVIPPDGRLRAGSRRRIRSLSALLHGILSARWRSRRCRGSVPLLVITHPSRRLDRNRVGHSKLCGTPWRPLLDSAEEPGSLGF